MYINTGNYKKLIIGEKLSQPIEHVLDEHPRKFNQKQAAQFAKDLKARIKTSTEIVNNNLNASRTKMKQQYDKRSRNLKFSVGDIVMLWKPYKKKGLSGCFQPKWDGPWSIVKFTGKRKMNCKIIRCEDSEQTLNVHVNQLKIVQENENGFYIEKEVLTDKADHNIIRNQTPDTFLDYLDDFGELDDRFVNDNDIGNPRVEQRPVEVAPAQQIDQRWVSLDASNIIPGDRTRGARRDYSEYR